MRHRRLLSPVLSTRCTSKTLPMRGLMATVHPMCVRVRTRAPPSLSPQQTARQVPYSRVQRPCSASRAKRWSSLAVLSFAAAVLRLAQAQAQAQGVCAHHAIPAPTSTSPPKPWYLHPRTSVLLQTHHRQVPRRSIPEEYICIPLPSLHLSTASRQPHQLSPSTTLLSFQGIAKTLVNSFYNTLTLRPLSASEPLRLILLALAYTRDSFPAYSTLLHNQPPTQWLSTCGLTSSALLATDRSRSTATPTALKHAECPTSKRLPLLPARRPARRPAPTKFFLSPAYDFNQAQPYGSTPRSSSSFGSYMSDMSPLSSNRGLTPSSSHSSLCSMQSVSSTAEASQLSDKARMELRAYAVSFEQVRLQRRRSY